MVCVPGDANFSSVVLLCHGDGTNGSTAFVDNSAVGHTLTSTGPVVSTASPKFGTGCISLSGSQKLDVGAIGTSFDMGTGDFTMEAWGYVPSLIGSSNVPILGRWGFGTNQFYFGFISGTLGFYLPSINLTAASAPSINVWHHFAVDRSGGTLRLYVDGAVLTSGAFATAFPTGSSEPCYLGGWTQGSSWPGFLDDIRVTKGVARYAGAFTPPTAAFPNSAVSSGCTPGGSFHNGFSERIAVPSPTLIAALAPLALGRAIERNRVTTRRRLLSGRDAVPFSRS